jgi:hypothetical protein
MDTSVASNPLAIRDPAEIHAAARRAAALLMPLDKEEPGVSARRCAEAALTAIAEANLTLRSAGAQPLGIQHLRAFFNDEKFRRMIVSATTDLTVKEMFDPPRWSYTGRGEAVRCGGVFEMRGEVERARVTDRILSRLNALGW